MSFIRIVRISKASWIKIATPSAIIHIDPGYTGYPQNQNLPAEELAEKASLIAVSHFHKDHLQPDAVKWLRDDKTTIVAPASCAPRIGGSITIVQPGDLIEFGDIGVEAVHAYNTSDGHSSRKVHRRGACVGYLLTLPGMTIYHAGDTDLIPEMKELRRVDVAILPIGGTFVMDAGEAAEAASLLRPRIVIPVHEARSDVAAFARTVESRSSTVVNRLLPGDVLELTL